MKERVYEITLRKDGKNKEFRFCAENQQLAHSHAMHLKYDTEFTEQRGEVMVSDNPHERVRQVAVRFIGWN